MENIKIAFSSCPNDTFMFEGWVHGRTKPIGKLKIQIADIEELNHLAIGGWPDVSKISLAAFPKVMMHYRILNSGSALGFKNGPLIVSRQKIDEADLKGLRFAIPGKNTTANSLLTALFPGITDKREFTFSEIEEAILNDEVDAGLIIHESRFTYAEKGLILIKDLGVAWEEKYRMPIPLGVIVVKKNLPVEFQQEVDSNIRESIEGAFAHPELSTHFIKEHALELQDEVIKKHIGLYVNEFSLNLGPKGRSAIRFFLQKTGLLTENESTKSDLFVPEINYRI